MADENYLPGTDILADTKAMIDGLKTVCANAGLANDSSEYNSTSSRMRKTSNVPMPP